MATIPTPTAQTTVHPPQLAAPVDLNAPGAASHAPAGPAAMATCDICYDRARLETVRDNLRLQIIWPLFPAAAGVHFYAR
ncbi:hypothetical protein ACVIN2_002751 [Bradyrhizobium sp. USDA 3650]